MGGNEGLPLLRSSSPLGVPGLFPVIKHLGWEGKLGDGRLLPFYENDSNLTQMGLLLIPSRKQHPELYFTCEHTGLYLATNYDCLTSTFPAPGGWAAS